MIAAKHQRIIVIFMTLAGMAFIASILSFLFLPALRDVDSIAQDVLDSQTELEAQYENRKNLLESISNVARIRQTTNDLKGQFLSPGDELLFITRTEEIAEMYSVESGIRISGTSVIGGKITGVNDIFDISLVGTYPNVLAAIRSIEKLPNMTIISAVRVQAGTFDPEEGPAIITASIKGTIVFTPEGL